MLVLQMIFGVLLMAVVMGLVIYGVAAFIRDWEVGLRYAWYGGIRVDRIFERVKELLGALDSNFELPLALSLDNIKCLLHSYRRKRGLLLTAYSKHKAARRGEYEARLQEMFSRLDEEISCLKLFDIWDYKKSHLNEVNSTALRDVTYRTVEESLASVEKDLSEVIGLMDKWLLEITHGLDVTVMEEKREGVN